MKVQAIYRPRIVTATQDERLQDAAVRMQDNEVSSLLVMTGAGAGAKPVGILTERDLARAISWGADPAVGTVGEYMTTQPVLVELHADVHDVALAMLELECRHLPVVDSAGRVIGMVSIRDLLGSVLRVA
jgi:CBS domain-containing protein